MQNFKDLIVQGREFLRSMGIHPLVFVAGVIFCLFFPRFFLLGAVGTACVWVAKNIGFPTKGKRRHK